MQSLGIFQDDQAHGSSTPPEWVEDANGKVDEPQREEPETEDIRTVTGGTIYKSAVRFEDLPISPELLQVANFPTSPQSTDLMEP